MFGGPRKEELVGIWFVGVFGAANFDSDSGSSGITRVVPLASICSERLAVFLTIPNPLVDYVFVRKDMLSVKILSA